MAEKIEVTCAVCGLHTIIIPARQGVYIIKCPNRKGPIFLRKFTRIEVSGNGEVTAIASYADGKQ